MLYCLECGCYSDGSSSSSCTLSGICTCNTNYTGNTCDSCKSDYYKSGSNCIGKTFASWYIYNLAWNV